MEGHWHVASGLAGYGPDGVDSYGTATTWRELADLVHDELRQASEYEYQGADALAESGDFEAAWDALKRSESLETLAANFNNARSEAPLYRDSPDAWDATVERMAIDHFPYDYDVTEHGARLRVYVWPHDDAECEHLAELEG